MTTAEQIQADAKTRVDLERQVIDEIAEMFQVTNSDAQGIFEINEFCFDQAWGMGLKGQALVHFVVSNIQ